MTYMNITLIGNVGREPELRFTSNGQAVCSFSLATNRRWTDRQTNEKREETTWFKVTVWGAQAETVNQYVSKGKQVLVIADRIQANAYTGQDGQPRASIDVTARDVRFLSDGGSRGGSSGGDYQDEYSGGGDYQQGDYQQPNDVDDIPF